MHGLPLPAEIAPKQTLLKPFQTDLRLTRGGNWSARFLRSKYLGKGYFSNRWRILRLEI